VRQPRHGRKSVQKWLRKCRAAEEERRREMAARCSVPWGQLGGRASFDKSLRETFGSMWRAYLHPERTIGHYVRLDGKWRRSPIAPRF
jgi:hypothetical protein